MPRGTVLVDIETCDKDLFWDLPPEKFVRLIGWKYWDEDEVHLTTDLDEIRHVIWNARGVITHNGAQFDLPAIFGVKSDVPLRLAMERRHIDTMVHAILANPAPAKYTDRKGTPKAVDGPESQLPWFGLDEQAHQLGVAGKTNDIKDLAAKWAPEYEVEAANGRIMVKKDIAAGFGLIPVDDPEYRDYLIGDVLASQEVARALLKKKPMDEYDWRQQEVAARIFVIRSNGFRVDIPKAQARVEFLEAQKEDLMGVLVEKYDFPTDGAKPWDTDPGKRATLNLLEDSGITFKKLGEHWPKTDGWAKREEHKAKALEKAASFREKVEGYRTEQDELKAKGDDATGREKRRILTLDKWIARDLGKAEEIEAEPLPPYFGLSLSGDTLKELTKDTPAEDTGKLLADLKGQRGLAASALEHVKSDGFCHPDIQALQKSGRWSTTKPALGVWDATGVEKSYWLPDNDDEVIVEFDLSNADARGVAALSGDTKYAERFEPGADGHLINAWAAWGRDVVGDDKNDPTTAHYRQLAKPGGHGWGYRIGARKLANTWKLPVAEAKRFLDRMNEAFKVVVGWQDRMVRLAVRDGHVTNPWGRRMKVDKGREYTQAPALMGQSFTTECMCDALLSFDIWALRKVKAQIHDAFVFSVPKKDMEKWADYIEEKMQSTYVPKDGQGLIMEMPASRGPFGDTWESASHR